MHDILFLLDLPTCCQECSVSLNCPAVIYMYTSTARDFKAFVIPFAGRVGFLFNWFINWI